MGREVRKVPKDWKHPRRDDGRDGYQPLLEGYTKAVKDWTAKVEKDGLQEAIDYFGGAPDRNRYMPEWTPEEADHLMMYEDTSEGTPISPAFKTPEELARWLADNGASSFGSMTATYEQWLAMIGDGWAPSAVSIGGGPLVSGVEAARVARSTTQGD
jgi:hypothetical protein